MSKDKIEEATEKGQSDREGRLNQGIAEKIIGGIGGIDLDKHGPGPGASEAEKEAYEKAYYNR